MPFIRKDEVRKLAAVLAGLVVLQKLAGDVWVWMPKKLHSLNGGHAHHDARRDWEAPFGYQSVQSSDGCQWKASLSVKGKQSSRGSFLESDLVIFSGLSGSKEVMTGCQKIG